MNFIKAIMPKEDAFFDMFTRHAGMLVGGADAMAAMFAGKADIGEACRTIADCEHRADDITRDVLLKVRRSFVTPFDRAAIAGLINAMDDAIDEMHKTAKAVTLYGATDFSPQMSRMSALAADAARLVLQAVPLLRSVGREAAALTSATEGIVRLEGLADDLHEQGLKALFHAHGAERPMAFVVGHEVYRHLERVLDRFEDVADEIHGIVIDHA